MLVSEYELFDKWRHAKDSHYTQRGYQLPYRNLVTFLPRFSNDPKRRKCTWLDSISHWGEITQVEVQLIILRLILEGVVTVRILITLTCSFLLRIALSSTNNPWRYCPRDFGQHRDVLRKAIHTHTHKYFLPFGFFFFLHLLFGVLRNNFIGKGNLAYPGGRAI
jgi:hypothetical protein